MVWPAVLWSDQTNRRFRQRRSRRMRSSGGHGVMPEGTGPLRDLHPQILRGGARAGSSIRCGRSARPLSQGHEGWVCLSQGYNDGGFSGATTDRPALQRLLADITAGHASAIRSAASSPTSSSAVRYWNRARQRYHRLFGQIFPRPRVSADPGHSSRPGQPRKTAASRPRKANSRERQVCT